MIKMKEKETIIHKLKMEMPFLNKEFGVSHIGIFGSYAFDNFNDSSDIDLLVKFEKPLGFHFFELADYLEKLLGKKVDIITSEGINSIRHESVKSNIERSAIYV